MVTATAVYTARLKWRIPLMPNEDELTLDEILVAERAEEEM